VLGVLQVIQQGQLRGAEVFALDLAAELARGEGWQMPVLALHAVDEPFARSAVAAGVDVIRVGRGGAGRARALDVGLVWRLAATISRGRYRVVQANGSGTLKYLVAARWLSRGTWRLVYRAIGEGSFWRRARVRRLFYRWLLSEADVVVAVGQAVARGLGGSLVEPRKVVVVPNGVSPARVQEESVERERTRLEFGVGPSEHLVIYVGAFSPEKNLGMLIEAIRRLRGEGWPVKALLLGDGPSRREHEEILRQNRLEDVIVLYPPQERIGRYLAAADLLVLPSLTEGMPAVVIEAGLMGLPSVASAVGGVPEIVADGLTGLLVPPGDQETFTRAIRSMLGDDTGRAAMGSAARARYRQYEIARIAVAYREVYMSLLTERAA
jgi:glycosyltransferase involved in cell wall biosynthesis